MSSLRKNPTETFVARRVYGRTEDDQKKWKIRVPPFKATPFGICAMKCFAGVHNAFQRSLKRTQGILRIRRKLPSTDRKGSAHHSSQFWPKIEGCVPSTHPDSSRGARSFFTFLKGL